MSEESLVMAPVVDARASRRANPAPAAKPEEVFHCQLATAFDELAGLREEWDEAVIRLGGGIYMTYDWCRTWWQFYGRGKQLRIFVFTAGDEVVGIMPLYIDCLGYWPLRYKVVRLVGASIPPKTFSPPLDAEWAEPIAAHLVRHLLQKERVDLLSFGPVSETHPAITGLQTACQGNQLSGARCCVTSGGVHTVFSLPASMEDYFQSLAKSERKKRQYELRLLHKQCRVSVEVLSDPRRVLEEFHQFVGHHTAQWNAERKPGHFGAWPHAREFNEALVKAHGALGRLRFIRLLADGQLVSNQYVFALGDTYYWELPARTMGPTWDRLSLGPAGAITMIEAAIQEGKRHVEGGVGHYEYKLKLGAQERQLLVARVKATTFGSRFRAAFYGLLRLCLQYGYHRGWYRRVTPRLPAVFRRPQWSLWLRFDF